MPDNVAPIDAQTALDLLEAAVTLTGEDHCYERFTTTPYCRYTAGDNPSCLVGVALAIHGVPLDTLRDWDANANLSEDGIMGIVQTGHAPFIDDHAADVFQVAQNAQDDGDTWGDALNAARHTLQQIAGGE